MSCQDLWQLLHQTAQPLTVQRTALADYAAICRDHAVIPDPEPQPQQVGMGATLLDGVVMEPGSIVAAGAVVPPGQYAPGACVLLQRGCSACLMIGL